jgi:hypothetical protein
LPFVTINLFQFHVGKPVVDVQIQVPDNKKLRFTGFRQEVIGGRGMPYRRPGLPAGTDMLLTGIYRHVEAGIRLCGSDPSAIQAKTGSGSWRTLEIRVVLQKINQCLGGFCHAQSDVWHGQS